MKKADSSRLETLEALIAEKRRQETFLAKLEERRAGTPEHVFNRLRDEYLTKLTDAQVKAAAEAELLSGGLEEDDAAVAEVEARLVTLEEERIETQLRADVEDWDPKETQKKLTAMTAAIAMAEKERDARRAVADRTRTLLAEARGGITPAPAPVAPAAPAPSGPPPMRPTTAGLAVGPNFDELAFLRSVVGRPSTPATPAIRDSKPIPQPVEAAAPEAPTAPVVPAAVPVPPAPPAAPRTPTPEPPAAIAPDPVPPPMVPPSPAAAPPPNPLSPAASPAPLDPQPSLELEPPAVVAPLASEPQPAPPAPASEPSAPIAEQDSAPSLLGRPTPRTSQQVKTLKCAECGSMNYPTEWYCERCGGELAAL